MSIVKYNIINHDDKNVTVTYIYKLKTLKSND